MPDVAELEIKIRDTGTAQADANLRRLAQAEQAATAAAGPLERTFQQIAAAAREGGSTIDRLNTRFAQLAAATTQSNARQVEGVRAAQAIGAGLGNLAGVLSTTTASVVRQEAATGSLSRIFSTMRGAVQDVGGSFSRLGAGIVVANQALALVSQVAHLVGQAIAAATRPAIDFETAWTGVRKTVNASEQDLRGLQVRLQALNGTLPLSTQEVFGVAEAAGQLGIRTQNIVGFTDVMVKLGATTNLSAQDAATSLARLANITRLPQEQFDRLGSTIVALGNNMATTEQEIVQMALRIAGAGHQVGLSEAQILSFAATLSSLGIEAEAGGTAISRIFIAIAKAVELGGSSLDTFATAAGTSSAQFAQAFRQNAAAATQQFIQGLADIEAQGGSTIAVLEELGLDDIRVGDALRRAAGGGDLLARSLELGQKAWTDNNALTKEAEQRFATTASVIASLGKDIEDLATRFGAALLPGIKDAVHATSEFINLFDDGASVLGSFVGGALSLTVKGFEGLYAVLKGIRDLTPDLSWLFSDSPGAQDRRANLTIDVGQYNSADAEAALGRRRRQREADQERARENALRASQDPFAYGQSTAPFAGPLGTGENTAPLPPPFNLDSRVDFAGPPELTPEDRELLSSYYGRLNEERERAAKRAEEEAKRRAALGQRSALGSARAGAIGADDQVAAAERQLEILQQQLDTSEQLATTDQQRLQLLTESEAAQLTAARELDAAQQRKLDAQIAELQVKQQTADLTGGERAELAAQIEQLQQQKTLIAGAASEEAKLRREFRQRTDELTASLVAQAQGIRDSVEPMEALTREMERLRDLAASVPQVGAILTPEVLDKYERDRATAITNTKDGFDELIDATRHFGQQFSRTMAEALSPNGARVSFREFLSSLVVDVNEFVIQKTLTDPLLDFVNEQVIKPIQGKSGSRSMVGAGVDFLGGLFGGPHDPVPYGPTPDGGNLDTLNAAAGQAGDTLLAAAQKTDAGFAGIIGDIGNGFLDLFSGLGDTIGSLFSSLFGENGFDVAGFFGSLVGGAAKGAVAHEGALILHAGGFGAMRPGEVPAILEAGELVLSKSLTRDILDTAKRGPAKRYHDGGLVDRDGPMPLAPLAEMAAPRRDRGVSGAGAGGRGGDTYNIHVTQHAQSLDPRTTAQLLQQQSGTIVGIIRRDIARGGGLSTDVGQRGS